LRAGTGHGRGRPDTTAALADTRHCRHEYFIRTHIDTLPSIFRHGPLDLIDDTAQLSHRFDRKSDRRLRARIDAAVGAHHRTQISRFGAASAPFLRGAVEIG
jgi:hypothetical protein